MPPEAVKPQEHDHSQYNDYNDRQVEAGGMANGLRNEQEHGDDDGQPYCVTKDVSHDFGLLMSSIVDCIIECQSRIPLPENASFDCINRQQQVGKTAPEVNLRLTLGMDCVKCEVAEPVKSDACPFPFEDCRKYCVAA